MESSQVMMTTEEGHQESTHQSGSNKNSIDMGIPTSITADAADDCGEVGQSPSFLLHQRQQDFLSSMEIQVGQMATITSYEASISGSSNNRRVTIAKVKCPVFFHSNMVNFMSYFRNTKKFVDLTVGVQEELIPCHKLVVASCSTYFEDILTREPMRSNPHPVIVLKDYRISEVKTLVDFMYRGEIQIPEEHLEDLLKAAEKLGIKGLAVQNAFQGFDEDMSVVHTDKSVEEIGQPQSGSSETVE